MKSTSPLVLALLFAKVAADSDTTGNVEPSDIVQDIQDQSDEYLNSAQDDTLNAVAVHVQAKTMAASYSDNWVGDAVHVTTTTNASTTNKFDLEARPHDTISVEVYNNWGPGDFVGEYEINGEIVVTDDQWVCTDVDSRDGSTPEGWNTNAYDDRSWAPAKLVSGNSPATSSFKFGWTNPEISENAQFIWTDNQYSNHILCRRNFVDFDVRNVQAGECDAEMHQFQVLLNEMIAHHRDVEEYHHGEIEWWSSQLVSSEEDVQRLEGLLQTSYDETADLVEDHNALVEANRLARNEAIESLEASKNLECEGIVDNAEDIVRGLEQEKFDLQVQEHDDYVSGLREQHSSATIAAEVAAEEAQAQAVQEKTDEMIAAHALDLAAKIQANTELNAEAAKLILENSLADLVTKHDALIAQQEIQHNNAIATLKEGFAAAAVKVQGIHDDEIDALTRKHDYLYESCTTVQVVDGELKIE